MKINVDQLEVKSILPGFEARFVHGAQITIGYVHIKEGGVLPTHAHPHEQITRVIEGKLRMCIGEEWHELGPNELVMIPCNVPHSAIALEDTIVEDVFSPVRSDYK